MHVWIRQNEGKERGSERQSELPKTLRPAQRANEKERQGGEHVVQITLPSFASGESVGGKRFGVRAGKSHPPQESSRRGTIKKNRGIKLGWELERAAARAGVLSIKNRGVRNSGELPRDEESYAQRSHLRVHSVQEGEEGENNTREP